MKHKLPGLFLISLFVVFGIHANGQGKVVRGFVTTFDSIPLFGVEIKVKSTGEIVKTDTLGNFSVGVAPKDKLLVRAHGFNNVNVKLKEKTKFAAINMKMKKGEENRAYAIGYGYVMDKDKLNAISQKTNDDLDFSTYKNMYDLIRGRFAGVQIDANGDIIIRGKGSFEHNAALIVVDGIPASTSVLTTIPPAHVKSINILKDASAAIYGSRGANGVVIIETKKGMED